MRCYRLAKGRVFHVKQPDEAEVKASFSFDDTPLAREIADLSARRRALIRSVPAYAVRLTN